MRNHYTTFHGNLFNRNLLLGLTLLLLVVQVRAQNTCATPFVIASIPFSSGTQTTCGTVNDYAAGTLCNVNYGGGEDYVYSLDITTAPVTYNFALGGTGTWKIMSVHSACPPTSGTCVGSITTSSGTSGSTSITFPTNGTYYIIIDTWPTPNCGQFTLSITAPPPPPANNECSTATALSVSSGTSCTTALTGQTTSGATQSQVACLGTADDDVWYSFTAISSSHTISLSNVSGSTDMLFQVFSGSCGSLTSLLCSDPNSGTVSGLTAGNTYFVRVHTYGSGNNATFDICVTTPPAPPANDQCSGAITLTPAPTCTPITGTTENATDNNETGDCTAGTENAVWYKFTATATSHTVTVDGSASFDAVIGALVNCGSSTRPTGGSCTDNTADDGVETLSLSGLTIGATYLIQVHDYNGDISSTSTFDICVTEPPAPPANDNICGAIALNVSSGTSCTTLLSGQSTQSATQSLAACAGTADEDVWYSFVATSTSHIVTLSNSGAGSTDRVHQTYSSSDNTCSGTLTSVICSDPENSTLSGLTIGNTYFIRVHSYGIGNFATFDICVTTPPLPPANDLCSGAIAVSNGSSISVSNALATDESTAQAPTCGGVSTNTNGLWYLFQSTPNVAETITIEGCNSNFDMRVKVYTGTCATPTCLTGDDNDDCNGPGSGLAETTSFNVPSTPSSANYYIFISGADGTLEFNIAVVLPLELTKFEGKSMSKSNMLTWETAIEKDVQWHIVERAADGVNFTEVGRTAGQLASSAPKKYELEDLRPIGKAYYRLRSVDLDGKESLSSVIVLERKGARFQIDNVFPSPTQGDLTVQFNAVEESTVNVMVYDFSGRLVLQQQLDAVKGFNQTTLQLGSLPAGMYNVTIVGTQSATEPVRIVKE